MWMGRVQPALSKNKEWSSRATQGKATQTRAQSDSINGSGSPRCHFNCGACLALGRLRGDGEFDAARYLAANKLGCRFGGDAELVMGGASRFMQARRYGTSKSGGGCREFWQIPRLSHPEMFRKAAGHFNFSGLGVPYGVQCLEVGPVSHRQLQSSSPKRHY
jgi:hypothetical protein